MFGQQSLDERRGIAKRGRLQLVDGIHKRDQFPAGGVIENAQRSGDKEPFSHGDASGGPLIDQEKIGW